MKNLINYILPFLTAVTYGQISCDKTTLSDLERKFLRADKRGKAGTYYFADLTFDIAECYRQKHDTTCLKWYRRNIQVTDSAFKYCTKESRERCNKAMGHHGISSFYIGEYDMAIKYLEKVLGYSQQPDYHYFLGLAHMKIEHYDIALVELENFKENSVDKRDVDDLIKECQVRRK